MNLSSLFRAVFISKLANAHKNVQIISDQDDIQSIRDKDRFDLEKIERDAMKMESESYNMRVMKWIIKTNFYLKYEGWIEEIEKMTNTRWEQKSVAVKENFNSEFGKKFYQYLPDENIFIDKLISESNLKG